MRSLRFPLLLSCGVLGFVAGTIAIERVAIDRLLKRDAVTESQAWTDFLAQNLLSLPWFVASGDVPPGTRDFIERVRPASRIFLFKVFDRHGKLLFISDSASEGATDEAPLVQHNPEAEESIQAGQPLVETGRGTDATRPAFYSETYIPLRNNAGDIVGVVESYIDQTAKRASFEQTFLVSSAALCALVVLAFGLPAIGWYRRRNGQEKADERIQYLSSHDGLLGLFNRAAAVRKIDDLLAAPSGRAPRIAIHKIDIDRFRDINNSVGLEGGDEFLQRFAGRLVLLGRQRDIVARLGADEFVLIQMDIADTEDAQAFARSLLREMSRPLQVADGDMAASVCIGTAVSPDHGMTAERLMRAAKLALAHAKTQGPGHAHLFSADLDIAMQRRLRVERAVAQAITTNGFGVHYQPIFDNRGALVGFEALARLPSPDEGFIPPDEFIAAAERTGVIDQVGAFIIETACEAAATWPEQLSVSVNLSPKQFHTGSVPATIAATLARTGLAPGRLLLEITESLLLEDRPEITRQLQALKELGTPVVMDDFGIGYSSLSYLWRFPFDKIKIDASFMRGVAAGEKTAIKVVQSITLLGQALGMRVCVEGVETERQAAFARTLGCDEVQGYFFARPAPPADVAAIVLADYRRRHGIKEAATPVNGADSQAAAG